MPHGHKRRVNPKKKGQKARHSAASTGSAFPAAESASASAEPTPVIPPLPAFQNQNESTDGASTTSPLLDTSKESVYVRYKKSTQRIKTVLQSMVPAEIFQIDSANAVMEAADYIVDNDMEVDSTLLNDLKFSIRVRKRIAEDKYGGGDEGHSHFIAVLVYCWSVLSPRRKRHLSTRSSVDAEEEADVPLLCNRFEGLATEGDSDDEYEYEDDEYDLPQTPQERPVETVPTRLTWQELSSGTDRIRLSIFLYSLEELMRCNACYFRQLNEASEYSQQQGEFASVIVAMLMAASVAANSSIQQAAALEQAFIRDNPHMNTVYRAFANVSLLDLIRFLTATVTAKSPIAIQFSEKHAVEFVGDAMECAFRHGSDPQNKQNTLVRDFLERWEFPDDTPASDQHMAASDIYGCAQLAVAVELDLDRGPCTEWKEVAKSFGRESHSWILGDHTGRNRAISHTIHLLQRLSPSVKQRSGRLSFREGSFGESWVKRKKAATRIQVEMDELLMVDIMPTLLNLCSEGLLSQSLPYKDELFAGFAQIKTFVDFPDRPISWSLAFTVHTILTAIFETQGSQAAFMTNAAETAFNKFFKQLEWVVEKRRCATGPESLPSWNDSLIALQCLQHLVRLNIRRTIDQTKLAIWNPFCAGAFLSYISYYGNLSGGTTLVDSVGQLRMALHLFHALKQVRAIEPDQIVLLDILFEIFKDCSAIWSGPLPIQGQFERHWESVTATKNILTSSLTSRGGPTGKIDLQHMSKSFRRICLRRGLGAKDTCKGARRQQKGPLYMHSMRVHTTCNAMFDDEQLLGTNLTCVGFYLVVFFIRALDQLGHTRLWIKMACEAPNELKRTVGVEFLTYHYMSSVFGALVLGRLDKGDRLLAKKCAAIMGDFFDTIPPENIMWFVPRNN